MKTKRCTMPCVLTALLVLALFASPQKARAEEGIALLTGLTGRVETARSDGETWRRAEIGLTLRAGDRLRTGDGAKATLLLGDGRTLHVLPNSVVSVSAEMGREKSSSSGVSNAMRSLWNALVSKFNESRDIDVTTGVVGTVRGPKRPLTDAALSDDEEKQLAEQVSGLEVANVDSVSRLIMLAVMYEGAKQYARAEENYLEAIELSPLEGRLYDTLGSLYARLGQKEKFNDLKERKQKVIDRPKESP